MIEGPWLNQNHGAKGKAVLSKHVRAQENYAVLLGWKQQPQIEQSERENKQKPHSDI